MFAEKDRWTQVSDIHQQCHVFVKLKNKHIWMTFLLNVTSWKSSLVARQYLCWSKVALQKSGYGFKLISMCMSVLNGFFFFSKHPGIFNYLTQPFIKLNLLFVFGFDKYCVLHLGVSCFCLSFAQTFRKMQRICAL